MRHSNVDDYLAAALTSGQLQNDVFWATPLFGVRLHFDDGNLTGSVRTVDRATLSADETLRYLHQWLLRPTPSNSVHDSRWTSVQLTRAVHRARIALNASRQGRKGNGHSQAATAGQRRH